MGKHYPEEVKRAVVAEFAGGKTLYAIARARGINEETVRSWVRRGMARELQPEAVAPPSPSLAVQANSYETGSGGGLTMSRSGGIETDKDGHVINQRFRRRWGYDPDWDEAA